MRRSRKRSQRRSQIRSNKKRNRTRRFRSTLKRKARTSHEDFETLNASSGTLQDQTRIVTDQLSALLLANLPQNSEFRKLLRFKLDAHQQDAVVGIPMPSSWVTKLKNFRNSDLWIDFDNDDPVLETPREKLDLNNYELVSARVMYVPNCNTQTRNYHLDAPFGINIDAITNDEQRQIMKNNGFTGYHNFIMCAGNNSKCTTRYIPHYRVSFLPDNKLGDPDALERMCQLAKALFSAFNEICENLVTQEKVTLQNVPLDMLTNVVDYYVHRGPTSTDLEGTEDTERWLFHACCKKKCESRQE